MLSELNMIISKHYLIIKKILIFICIFIEKTIKIKKNNNEKSFKTNI